jgi:hypothetical protein
MKESWVFMHLNKSLAVVSVCSLLMLTGCQSATVDGPEPEASAPASEEASAPTFKLNVDEVTNLEGVSPELVEDPAGGYLLLTTGLGQNRVYRSADGVSFTPDPSFRVPMGNDYSLVQKPDGSWLLYYITFDAPQAEPGKAPDPSKAIKTVMVSTAAELTSFGDGVPTGIKQDKPGPAWGVPETYITPDGTYQMMWVDMVEGQNSEVLRTANSTDGITYTANDGFVISGGYVDPFMLRVDANDWVLLLSTTPARLPQKIYVAKSTDGISWEIDPTPLLEDAEKNYLDPAAVSTGAGKWLVVLSTAEKDNAISGPHNYVIGTLLED